MNRVHQAFSLAIVAFSIWVGVEAVQLNYYTALGPGPGFFPFWLAVIMGGLAAAWFVQLWFHPEPGRAIDFMPDRAGCARIVALILAVAVFGLVVEEIGFSVSMFIFLLFLLVALGRQNVYVTLSVSTLGSFGVFYLFTNYLNVHLPKSSIEFLLNLGF